MQVAGCVRREPSERWGGELLGSLRHRDRDWSTIGRGCCLGRVDRDDDSTADLVGEGGRDHGDEPGVAKERFGSLLLLLIILIINVFFRYIIYKSIAL